MAEQSLTEGAAALAEMIRTHGEEIRRAWVSTQMDQAVGVSLEESRQQAQMQKMSQYMIFLFPLFLYNAPSGLNLYIFASTIGGLFDTYLVRKTLKKRGILPATAEA